MFKYIKTFLLVFACLTLSSYFHEFCANIISYGRIVLFRRKVQKHASWMHQVFLANFLHPLIDIWQEGKEHSHNSSLNDRVFSQRLGIKEGNTNIAPVGVCSPGRLHVFRLLLLLVCQPIQSQAGLLLTLD